MDNNMESKNNARKNKRLIVLAICIVLLIGAAIFMLTPKGSKKDEFAGDGYGEATTAASEIMEDVPEDKISETFLSGVLKLSEEDTKGLMEELTGKIPEKIVSYEVEEYNEGGFAVRCITAEKDGVRSYYLVGLTDDMHPDEVTGPFTEGEG